jgi:hypothetical protein
LDYIVVSEEGESDRETTLQSNLGGKKEEKGEEEREGRGKEKEKEGERRKGRRKELDQAEEKEVEENGELKEEGERGGRGGREGGILGFITPHMQHGVKHLVMVALLSATEYFSFTLMNDSMAHPSI